MTATPTRPPSTSMTVPGTKPASSLTALSIRGFTRAAVRPIA